MSAPQSFYSTTDASPIGPVPSFTPSRYTEAGTSARTPSESTTPSSAVSPPSPAPSNVDMDAYASWKRQYDPDTCQRRRGGRLANKPSTEQIAAALNAHIIEKCTTCQSIWRLQMSHIVEKKRASKERWLLHIERSWGLNPQEFGFNDPLNMLKACPNCHDWFDIYSFIFLPHASDLQQFNEGKARGVDFPSVEPIPVVLANGVVKEGYKYDILGSTAWRNVVSYKASDGQVHIPEYPFPQYRDIMLHIHPKYVIARVGHALWKRPELRSGFENTITALLESGHRTEVEVQDLRSRLQSVATIYQEWLRSFVPNPLVVGPLPGPADGRSDGTNSPRRNPSRASGQRSANSPNNRTDMRQRGCNDAGEEGRTQGAGSTNQRPTADVPEWVAGYNQALHSNTLCNPHTCRTIKRWQRLSKRGAEEMRAQTKRHKLTKPVFRWTRKSHTPTRVAFGMRISSGRLQSELYVDQFLSAIQI